MSQALYRKWRPQQWNDVVGQEHVIQTLYNAVVAQRVGHAYLFAGPRGTGKTTSARLLAKAVNCLAEDVSARPCNACDHCSGVNQGRFLDLIEIDAASNTSVDDVRALREKINFAPNQGQFKVYIIDEVHMLSTAAFNALLKTLEEPPPHAIFVLATTEIHKIPATVLSRCQRHEFRRIPVADIVKNLRTIASEESIEVKDETLTMIARQATGGMRDAISLLDQLASTTGEISLEMAQDVLGTATSQTVLAVVDALQNKDIENGLTLIHTALDTGSDPRQFARQIVDYLRKLLLILVGNVSENEESPEVRHQMAAQARAFSPPELLRLVRIFTSAAVDTNVVWQPGLPLEMAMVEAISGEVTTTTQPAPVTVSPPTSKASPPARPTASQPSPIPKADRGALDEKWRTVINELRQHNRSTQGLVNSSKLLELRNNNTIIIGFASKILVEKMTQGEHIALTEKVMEQVFGRSLKLRCVVASDAEGGIPAEVDADGMVAAAVRLGGKIVDARDVTPAPKRNKKQ